MAVSKLRTMSTPFLPDERQRAAIEHVEGPMLVVAGAGTGKTTVLTHRIEKLVRDGHARPDEILALTYTFNAAAEMRKRTKGLLGAEVQAHTFHDYCLELLKAAGQGFGVLDDKDLWIYLRRRMPELRLHHYIRASNVAKFLGDLTDFISRCHDELVTPERYQEYVRQVERGEVPVPRVLKSSAQVDDAEVVARCQEIARVFSTVEGWLREQNLGTFSHMITRAHALLTSSEGALEAARSRARFILADEFQDANFAQIRILARLAGAEGNLFAVGDPDQSIYKFRGASSAAFELFRRSFPAARLVVLEKNRRSVKPILQTAFAVVQKNPPVFEKQEAIAYQRKALISAREEQAAAEGLPRTSERVELVILSEKSSDGSNVVQLIQEMRKKYRCKWSDFGILYRSHHHRDDVVAELAEKDVPFVIENMDVSDTAEARDLFACLSAVVSSGDDVSLFRVAALPRFRVNGEELRQVIRALARENREEKVVPLAAALDRVAGGAEVLAAIRETREEIRGKNAQARVALDVIVRNFGLDKGSAALQAALQFVAGWEYKAVNRSTDLKELVEYLEYFREAGGAIPLAVKEDEDAVRLMTVHGAKGLEFPHVIILRASSGSFPCSYRETLVEFPRELRDQDSAATLDDKTLHDHEERRLFYVAMTRARDTLHIFANQGRGEAGKRPLRYPRELMDDRGLTPWLAVRPAAGAQAPLELVAEASGEAENESRVDDWLTLPVLDGLHKRLSASAIDTYERCGLQFRLERDWKLAKEPAAAMQYGATMHRVLKTYFDSVKGDRERTSEEEIIAMFRESLAAAKIQEKYQQDLYEEMGVRQLRDFLATAQSIPAEQVLKTEEWFEIPIGETVIAGRIDRIDQLLDGTVAIVDYKTGSARDQEDADKSLQLSIYAIAAKEKWGYDVGALVLHNLDGNVPVRTRRDEAELLATRSKVEDVAAKIARGIFEAKPGNHCNFCAYRSLCPKKEKMISRRVEAAEPMN